MARRDGRDDGLLLSVRLPPALRLPDGPARPGRTPQGGPGRRGRRHPGGRLRHRAEPGPLPRARPQDHHGRSQPRHEQAGPEADRRQRHRGRSAGARRRGPAVRRGDVRLRGEHLDHVQHPGRRSGIGRGLPGPEAGRSARLPGARAERGPQGPGLAASAQPDRAGPRPTGAAWTWTSRPSSGASRSGRSRWSGSRWRGCRGPTGRCTGASG